MNTSLNRHRNIIDFALSSLLRRKMKNFSLLAVYTLIIFVIASLLFFVHALKREAALLLSDAPDMVVQRLMAGRNDLIPDSYAEKIRSIPGVRTVTPRLWGYYYDPVFGANYTLMVPPKPTVEPGSILVGAEVSLNQRVRVGDMVALRTSVHTPLLLTVKGIYPSASNLVAADLIIMSAEDFQAMFNLPKAHATDLAVAVANPRELATVAAKIVEEFPDTRPILKSEMLRTYDSIFDWRGGMIGYTFRGSALLCHLRLGQGDRPFRRRAAGDRHPQIHRLGNERCTVSQVLGRDRDLAERFSAGGSSGLRPCVLLFRIAVRTCAQGVGRTLSAIQTGADD